MKQRQAWALWVALFASAFAPTFGCASGQPDDAVAEPDGDGEGAGGATQAPIPSSSTGGCADCACDAGEQGACYTGPAGTKNQGVCADGVHTCQSGGEFGTWGPCVGEVLPGEEVCDDALDNDCDGVIDEGCNCVPAEETCDGLDNDCDGVVDEGLVQACPDACDQQACVGGGWTACGASGAVFSESFEAAPAPEVGLTPPGYVGAFAITLGDVDTLKAPAGLFTPAHTGDIAIDLNGWSAGAIAATVATVPGETYALTFAYTKNPSPEVTWAIAAKVFVDGVDLLDLNPDWPNDYSSLAWSCAALTFTATGTQTVIEIMSLNSGNGGVYLDSVLVKQQ